MTQGTLAFQYQSDHPESRPTALAGLLLYLDLAAAAGLHTSIRCHLHVRAGDQGWSDTQTIESLIMLNLAGGDSVDDLGILEGDKGLTEVWRKVETHGMTRQQRRAHGRRLRAGRQRALPSPSSVFRYLDGCHDPGQEAHRQPGKAFIPEPNDALQGLARVNADLVAFAQRCAPQRRATLDMDATLIETHKKHALFCYQSYKAYQALNVYWAEQELVPCSQFRDGNVPAGYRQLEVFEAALESLPPGVDEVRLRSDTAGYEHALLRYCAEGKSERFGVIKFAVGADVTPAFKTAVAAVAEADWHPLLTRKPNGTRVDTGQQWAEVCYVPNQAALRKDGPEYRFVAIREPLRQPDLPGLQRDPEQLPFPTMEFGKKGTYKVFGTVTNFTREEMAGDELIGWYRERCGKSEEVHGMMKTDLAGGQMPSAKFGVNAAWWAIMLLALNLNTIMRRQVLPKRYAKSRMKALRLWVIKLPGRVVRRSRQLWVRVSAEHPSWELLLGARRRILALATGPPG